MTLVQKKGRRTRYYSVSLYPTLFDDFLLIQHCGQRCTTRSKKSYFRNRKEALLNSLNVISAKKEEGYELLRRQQA